MSQITGQFIKDDSVKDEDILLDNGDYLRSRNGADTGNVNLIRANDSDKLEHEPDIEPGTDNARSLGSTSKRYLNIFSSALSLLGQGLLKLFDADSSNSISIRAPATLSTDLTWTLPNSNGTNGQALTTDGTGSLSWSSSGSGANTALSNLTTTSINQDLIFQSNKKLQNLNQTLLRKNSSVYGAPIEVGDGTANTGAYVAVRTSGGGSCYAYLTNGTNVCFFGLDGSGLQNEDPGAFLVGTLSAKPTYIVYNGGGNHRIVAGAARVEIKNVPLNFPSFASDPGAPVAGDTYFNTTDSKLKTYDGTTWQAHW